MIAKEPHGDTSIVRTWPWAFPTVQGFKDELLQLFPWADKEVDEAWYREKTVGNFVGEHGLWSSENESYEFDKDFDDWFRERFASTIAPYATTLDGRSALWRLELKLNEEGRAALERDQHEMIEDAVAGSESESERDFARSEGSYTIESIENYVNFLDNLVFVYGEDEEHKESLLVESALFDKSEGLIPEAVEAILRHSGIASVSRGWSEAFNQRFSKELDPDDSIVRIASQAVDAWLWDLRNVTRQHGS